MKNTSRVNMVPTNFFGMGAINSLPHEIKKRGYKRALVITDKFIYDSKMAKKVCDTLGEVGIESYIYYGVEANPTIETIDICVKVAKEVKPDFLIALGGGSPIDAAKALSIVYKNGGSVADYEGVNKSKHKGLPLVVINTTAGTGSEVTSFYIITDSKRNSKMVMVDDNCMVDITVNDIDFMITMPERLTAATGMDAMTHAIESILSKEATPLTDKDAQWAIRVIKEYLPRATRNGNDLEARTMMAYAAHTAGIAFSNSGLGMVHAMAHSLGGFYNLPHGICNAILLPYVMEFNSKNSNSREGFEKVARALNIKVMKWHSDSSISMQVINTIKQLNRQIGIPAKLSEFKEINPKDFSRLSELALEDTCMLSNQVMPSLEQVISVYQQAF